MFFSDLFSRLIFLLVLGGSNHGFSRDFLLLSCRSRVGSRARTSIILRHLLVVPNDVQL